MKHLQNLHTQNNLGTADPLFVVFEKEKIYHCENGEAEYEWRNDDLGVASEEEAEKLDKLARDFEETKIDGEEYEKVWFVKKDRFVTACLTRAGADDYLRAKAYDLTEPFIYVASLYRNREMIEVRQHLMATHRPQSPWQPTEK